MRPSPLIAFCLAAITGCQPVDVSPDVNDVIALCSAGIGLKTSASLQAELSQLRTGGTLSAKAEQEIRGALFSNADLSEEGTQRAYKNYIACVTGEVDRVNFLAQLENRKTQVVDGMKATDAPIEEIEAIEQLINDHIAAAGSGNQRLAHDLHSEITKRIVAFRNKYGSETTELYLP